VAERHRLYFYRGHLEAFDWNLLARDVARRPSRNEHFERLFAFGIDPLDGNLPTDTEADWPPRDELEAWIRTIRADVDEVLAKAPLTEWLERGWAAHLAIEHREMHAETLCYLVARLPPEQLQLPEEPAIDAPREVTRAWCEVPAGVTTLGLSRAAHPELGWDNEYEAHRVEVPAFRIASHKTTEGEWLEFVAGGGEAPVNWSQRAGQWWVRTLAGERPLDARRPVFVSHAQASAYAAWRGARLPTEAEWQRAATGEDAAFPWGDEAPQPGVHGNFGERFLAPTPLGAFPRGASVFGLDEPMGNGWEWTSTPFAPFEGFAPLPFYRGYSEPFFDGRHFVMKGASPRTRTTFLRRSFRNWFQPQYPYVFAGVRLVKEV
jgi:formylglycine-generating enzyme required for sulfatase activity